MTSRPAWVFYVRNLPQYNHDIVNFVVKEFIHIPPFGQISKRNNWLQAVFLFHVESFMAIYFYKKLQFGAIYKIYKLKKYEYHFNLIKKSFAFENYTTINSPHICFNVYNNASWTVRWLNKATFEIKGANSKK